MPESVNTHCLIASGAGVTTTADVQVGGAPLELPAGGPWIIHDVFCQVVSATLTPAESLAGHFRFDPLSGDVSPDPSPSRFPVAESQSYLGATGSCPVCPLNLFPVNWQAAGKATVNAIYANGVAVTVAPQIVQGIVFSRTIPEKMRTLFSDRVRTTKAAAAESLVGTITLSQKATKITGVLAMVLRNGVLVAGEELTGYIRLASDDIGLSPSQWPFAFVTGAGLGATVGGGNVTPMDFIPVDMDVPAGARISVYATFNTAVTNAADVEVFLAYV
jgi:hypothetical protein